MSWYSSPCYLAELEEQAAADRSSHCVITNDAQPCADRDGAGAEVHDAAAAASLEKAAPQGDGRGDAALGES